ncbi:hypothetical protein A7K93_00305 [Candidatus Methylacidiphilum fumarolicum]|uniref:Uncharacterized protein n=2 Tax=Candidatus Methylacidiphilum fumarolicum TaxID=591154 RepID=I0K113_METFB|nr:hypothetical protein [Candidatus Methylacidiphilum fumarolicum]MBW6413949.1 hypothetical protein [Candidatus Methylacidiphilum fumarolicum]TFE70494.1 hypothetical protein A7K73_03440 [Candidatus Methylacidiphilum fumarolicum]TFE74787.1 hypothetical protein A7K72_03275 [Candidatus Methylacidiphilum fumarolicum]TFE76032.1 hypothetical protein A7K93_00305 [Candidatus Methylacidiphilum fumarolicum]TFE76382.1 hypothetical protein A7D33_00630 [Candidatus Methylacidiphilum fumarolicum]
MTEPSTVQNMEHTLKKRGMDMIPLLRLFALVYCWIAVPALLAYFYEMTARAGADHLFIFQRIVERNFYLLIADISLIALALLLVMGTKVSDQPTSSQSLLPFWGTLWIGYIVARLSTPGHIPMNLWMGIYALFLALIAVAFHELFFKGIKKKI